MDVLRRDANRRARGTARYRSERRERGADRHLGPGELARGRQEPSRNSPASAAVLCIFQLAATSGSRSGIVEGLHAGELAPLHQLERGAAPRGEPVDLIGEAEVGQGRGGVATPDHGLAGRPGEASATPASRR